MHVHIATHQGLLNCSIDNWINIESELILGIQYQLQVFCYSLIATGTDP